ncbi:B4 [Carabus blaptoides fortunei]
MADRRKSHLRRYHSHDSQANFGESSGESKDNSPDSTQDRVGSRSAPDSAAGSSPESTGDRGKRQEYEVKDFLDRYSLPRVVRVTGGEPMLLYRCFDNFTKVQARAIAGRRGKEKTESQILHFPEGYPGWFSLINDKGERCALMHSTLLHLVREQVCSFLSLVSFTAYTAHPPDPTDALPRIQYLKTVVRAGQVFRLRAVFQHRDKPEAGRHSTRSDRMSSRSARDRDLANRYAQLIDINNQELYAPLTTKGEFYEIHSSTKARLCFPGMLDKTGPLALDKDCLYRLAHLLRRVHLPIKVKLMSGPLPPGLPKDFPDTFILDSKFQEPLLVTCTLPASSDNSAHEISCINISSKLKLTRSMLGFDSEYKLFKSQRLQGALSHCHKNVEQWYRQVRVAPNIKPEPRPPKIIDSGDFCPGCRKSKKSCNGRCEIIIKYNSQPKDEEIRRYTEHTNIERQLITKEVLEKFPKPKKCNIRDPNVDGCEKVRSIDRYKDMSKLIEEKFGKKQYNPVKKSASFMFSTKRIDLEETPMKNKGDPSLLKCQSLDAQLCLADASNINKKHGMRVGRKRGSDVSESFSHEFQMCILDNEKGFIDNVPKSQGHSLKDLRSLNMVITEIDLDEIAAATSITNKPAQPDLIPAQNENSFITERLCSEFHVKTKVQKKSVSKHNIIHTSSKVVQKSDQVHVVQVHSTVNHSVQNRALPVVDDLPYSHVVDEVRRPCTARTTSESENVYAEICDSKTRCKCPTDDRCACAKRHGTADAAEYCYVKLGSNGDSITQSSDDDIEAIYNTLR